MFLKLTRNNRPAPPASEESDEALVALYRKTKDLGIIGRLFERYTHLVYGVCLKYLKDEERSKDAVMEIFEELFAKLGVHDVHNFKSWLYSVSRNHCLMEIRKEGSADRFREKLMNEYRKGDMELGPLMHLWDESENRVSEEILLSAVATLVQGQADCIRMMYLEDKSYKDIAGETGYSLNEVKSHIQNGKRNLKNYLLNLNDRKK